MSLDSKFSEPIRAAIGLSKKTINRYYDKTDHSEVYRIAMVLHPRHKLQYFRTARWEPEWIQTAEDIVRSEYSRKWAKRSPATSPSSNEAMTAVQQPSSNMFDSLSFAPLNASSTRSELDRYLDAEIVEVGDVLQWWTRLKWASSGGTITRAYLGS